MPKSSIRLSCSVSVIVVIARLPIRPGKRNSDHWFSQRYTSLFKRGMRGVYQHCDERHLHRYLAEFDFRYNARVALGVNDEQRAVKMVKGVRGKRLTYKTTDKKVSHGNAQTQGA